MKYFSRLIIFYAFILIAGCGTSNTIDRDVLDEYEVKQTFDEVEQDDFILRLVSEKEVYEQGEDVKLYAEIIYTGEEEEEVEIAHSEYPIYFTLHEKVRDYQITSLIREIGVQKVLAVNEPYRVDYKKQAIDAYSDESSTYQKFIEDFIARDDYPAGYYVVTATAMFYDGEAHRQWEAEIDFKVE